mmetsp:Transcript_133752/g.286023  ORF Transcript_133752/g.286023 Transcript_133752/m.286023 type:complete len:242 (+) Transcript_133752:227-952(+)
MPPSTRPVKILRRLPSRCCTVAEVGLALKSPTRTTPSPACACSCTSLNKRLAKVAPPWMPPEFRGRGPWWFTKSNFLPVCRCCKRSHIAARLPKYCCLVSSATYSRPWPSNCQVEERKAVQSAALPVPSPPKTMYWPQRPAALSTRCGSWHSWKAMTSRGMARPAWAMRRPALPPLPPRRPNRFHQNKLYVSTFNRTAEPACLTAVAGAASVLVVTTAGAAVVGNAADVGNAVLGGRDVGA